MKGNKIIFITGATSGFGLSIANKLVSEGHKVYGTSRNPAKIKEQVDFELLQLDVTTDGSVKQCIQELFSKTPAIDVVVNNAGMAVVGAVEETSAEQAKLQFETNFWGSVRVIKEILPVLRHQRRGHIINVGSLAGLIGVPFQGFYSASKHALAGYTKSLRFELQPFNIKLTLIEPGFFRTNLHHSFVPAAEKVVDYDNIRDRVLKTLSDSIEHAPSTDIVANLVSRVIRSKNPKFNYRVGNGATFLPILDFFFPKLYEFGAGRKFQLTEGGT
jgi:NAD(P)-dependent dehydrogenase (short-subunit alcohol dehydrogenase family)